MLQLGVATMPWTPQLLCPWGSAAAPCTHHRELDPAAEVRQ